MRLCDIPGIRARGWKGITQGDSYLPLPCNGWWHLQWPAHNETCVQGTPGILYTKEVYSPHRTSTPPVKARGLPRTCFALDLGSPKPTSQFYSVLQMPTSKFLSRYFAPCQIQRCLWALLLNRLCLAAVLLLLMAAPFFLSHGGDFCCLPSHCHPCAVAITTAQGHPLREDGKRGVTVCWERIHENPSAWCHRRLISGTVGTDSKSRATSKPKRTRKESRMSLPDIRCGPKPQRGF